MVPKLCLLLGLFGFSYGDYKVPNVVIDVFQPKGFRAYIPDEAGVELFVFHGQINSELDITKPGEFSGDIKKPTGSYWVYEEPNVALEIGDTLYYWVFIQNTRLGYRKENKWKVKEYVEKKPLQCVFSKTVASGQGDVCQDSVIFEDNFGDIDQSRWIIENYIPTRGPNFEFNSYENSQDTVYTKNNVLRIKPVARKTDNEVRGKLDLRFQCTRPDREECLYEHFGAQILPPVKSGKIRSKFSFLFGKIEVRAKLPAGDWIFPEIALIPANEVESVNASKIWIAYARGNENLKGNANDDIGARLLFAGEVPSPNEPIRSSQLVSVRGTEAYTKRKHLYTLVWEPGKITAYVDNVLFGEKVVSSTISQSVISLGVGIGGNNDFPDGYKSGTTDKPWKNKDIKQIKTFFTARNEWLSTWQDPATELQVDYVKIYAL